MSDQTLPVGTRLDDFKITEVLGEGGFGITYKAVDERLQREVAIKEYLPREFALRDETATVRPRDQRSEGTFTWGLKRFIDEARALALFKHPNIVAVIRYLEANGTAYLVMEYEEGKDLERWLAGRSESVPETMLVQRILRPLLDGLARIHEKGLLHRDIKPANVFMRRDGTPVLIDFGSSRAQGQGQGTTLTSIVSAGYSPFEQYGGSQKQGPWSDLYALAGTAYRVVAGTAPTDAIARHQGVTLPSAVDVGAGRYSERLLATIDRALSLDPNERPQSAAEFAAMLPEQSSTAGEQSVTQVRRPAAARKSRWLPVGMGLFAVGAVAVAALIYHEQQTPATVVQPEQPVAVPTDQPEQPVVAPTQVAPAEAGMAKGNKQLADDTGPSRAPDAEDERAILAGWEIPDDVDNYRANQIAGGLLAYASNKTKFDTCLAQQCGDLSVLMAKIEDALKGYDWSRGDFHGTIRLDNPRRLDNPDCPFLIDVHESIERVSEERTQQRSYCTSNGFDRRVDHAGPVNDKIVGAAG